MPVLANKSVPQAPVPPAYRVEVLKTTFGVKDDFERFSYRTTVAFIDALFFPNFATIRYIPDGTFMLFIGCTIV